MLSLPPPLLPLPPCSDSWRRHQSLWKTDKNSVLDKFKAKEPSCAAFEEKLSKYTKVSWERGGG